LQSEAKKVLAELTLARYARHIALLDLKALAELGDMPELAAACAAELDPGPWQGLEFLPPPPKPEPKGKP